MHEQISRGVVVDHLLNIARWKRNIDLPEGHGRKYTHRMAQQEIPLLSKIFKHSIDPVPVTLGGLAVALNVTVERLEPLVHGGWLRARSAGKLTSHSWIDAPTEAAMAWLRQWFQPVLEKPMFSRQDMAELLGVSIKEVLTVAAAHNVPVIYDPGLGHMFSVWAARNLLQKVLSGGREDSCRFDRQAILWNLLEGDPQRCGRMPKFDEQLEMEIDRVAHLEEPIRTTRSMALIGQFRDAKVIIDRGASLSSGQSQPAGPASESSANGNSQLIEACEKKFSGLI